MFLYLPMKVIGLLNAPHGVSYHLFADDKQLYTVVPSDEIHVTRQRLTSCISVLRDWCASRRLQQLNNSKTELIWFGTRTSLRRLSSAECTLTIDSMDVQLSDAVRDSTCFYHLHRLRQLECHVGVEVMKQLISSFISSRRDYCNTLLIGLPFSTIAPLQQVLNAAKRLLLGLSRRDHVRGTPSPEGATLAARHVQNPV